MTKVTIITDDPQSIKISEYQKNKVPIIEGNSSKVKVSLATTTI